MRSTRAFFIATTSMVLAACSASLVSTRVSTATSPIATTGMFYTLPRTVVQVSLPVILSETTAGPLRDYSPLFLPDNKARSDSRLLSFKPATFTTAGEPDPELVFHLSAAGKGALRQTLGFEFTEEGVVTGLKAEVESQTAELVLAGVSALSGILTRTAFASSGSQIRPADTSMCEDDITDNNWKDHFRQCFLPSGEQDRSHLIPVFDGLKPEEASTLQRAYVPSDQNGKDTRELFRARAFYDRITKLSENYEEALGQPDQASSGTNAVLDRTLARIKALKAEFLGKRTQHKWTGVFHVRPERTGTCAANQLRETTCASWQSLVLLKVAEDESGICDVDPDAGSGRPPAKLWRGPQHASCTTGTQKTIGLKMEIQSTDLATTVAGKYTQPAEAGLHFLIPARMDTRLVATGFSDWVEPAAYLMIAQHGILAALPSEMGGKSVAHDLKFYAASGALKSYTLASTPNLTPEMVNSLSTSANALLDARKAQREAEAADADPLNQLKRQQEVLNVLLAIQTACAELEDPPEECGR